MQQNIRQPIQRNYKLTTKQYMYTKLTINTQDIQLVLLGTDSYDILTLSVAFSGESHLFI